MQISMAIMPAASLRLLLFSLCGDAMGRSASAMKVRGASQPAFQKVRMKIRGAAQPAAKAKAKVKKCSKPRCRNNAASPRAKFCIGCFKDNARCTGARSTGAKGVIGNSGNSSAKGVIGNSGNSSAKGVIGNSGNSSAKGVIGNSGGGNSSAKGVIGNSGNRSAKGLMGNSGNTNSRQKNKIAALVIFYIELAAEARIKKPALNADAGTIDDTQLDLDKRPTEAEKHAIDIVDVGGTLEEEERSVEVGVCARCGANAVEVANAGDEGKVCRRCWRRKLSMHSALSAS